MTEFVERGTCRETGWRINGGHCGLCGRPSSQRIGFRSAPGSQLQETVPAWTTCCGWAVCYGYVCSAPWRAGDGRETWACCVGEAQRRFGRRDVRMVGSDAGHWNFR